ncbi:uncharacterized protein LOC114828260 [Galendromus occidentalis]|uniref:Uncharacterized protein LOC114828260 n=1 Tax=Galendromus occidentalis TaxID=34638 RepID=A0AAJ7SF77_9ACAR|nr:uncharacterized protein LOC114828260 [Galendromus occidentalis]
MKPDSDNDVDTGAKRKMKDHGDDSSSDYQPISKPRKFREKYQKTNHDEEKKENKKRKQSNKHSFSHKRKKQQPLESNADDNGAQDSDKDKNDNHPPKPSVTNVAKGIVQTVQKFGSDISDATGQLLNNVNSMSPTIETWTKRGQELAEQIRGEGFSIEGEILTNAQGPFSLHMKTPSFEYRSPAFVIDTDYKNYAVIWACQNNLINGFMRRENIWVLSRNKTLDSTIKRALHERLRSKTYATYFLMPTDQTNCK